MCWILHSYDPRFRPMFSPPVLFPKHHGSIVKSISPEHVACACLVVVEYAVSVSGVIVLRCCLSAVVWQGYSVEMSVDPPSVMAADIFASARTKSICSTGTTNISQTPSDAHSLHEQPWGPRCVRSRRLVAVHCRPWAADECIFLVCWGAYVCVVDSPDSTIVNIVFTVANMNIYHCST